MDTQIISARNPQWANTSNSAIVLECTFSHLPNEWLPFCAKLDDVESYGRELYTNAVNGEYGTIAPYTTPTPIIPTVVTMRQARLALLETGLLTQVVAAVQAAGEAATIEWEYAKELRREHPLTQQLASALTLTTQQLDSLFTLAATK